MAIMQGVVIETYRDHLHVRDVGKRQRVIVHTSKANQFRPGERILIFYSGAMTMSIPPQITASKIIMLPGTGPLHSHHW